MNSGAITRTTSRCGPCANSKRWSNAISIASITFRTAKTFAIGRPTRRGLWSPSALLRKASKRVADPHRAGRFHGYREGFMNPTVYLADLRYNYSGVLANDCMPLGVAYMKAVMDRDLPDVRSRLFAYPDRLLDAIDQHPPDVLMVSNYLWNEALSFHFARLARRKRPDTMI